MSSYIKCMWAHILLFTSCLVGWPLAPGHGAKIQSALKENPPGESWEKGHFCFFKGLYSPDLTAAVDQHASYKLPSALHFSFFQLIVLLWFRFAVLIHPHNATCQFSQCGQTNLATSCWALQHYYKRILINFVGFCQCCITSCFSRLNRCRFKGKVRHVGKNTHSEYFLQPSAN